MDVTFNLKGFADGTMRPNSARSHSVRILNDAALRLDSYWHANAKKGARPPGRLITQADPDGFFTFKLVGFSPGTVKPEATYAHSMRVLLNALVRLDLYFLENAKSPVKPLLSSGVVYWPEPQGEEYWLPIPALYRLGYGDCEDLASARAAEIIFNGGRAENMFRYRKMPDGHRRYHIVVEHFGGREEDPSADLGMYFHRIPHSQKG